MPLLLTLFWQWPVKGLLQGSALLSRVNAHSYAPARACHPRDQLP